ncbi:MAG: outer membrane protein transport protein, partial [Limnobacter sp.]|nr:outer membrane protein transport protein [Limnobacter sp.]
NCPTNPPSNTGNPFCGSGPAGVNLEQLVVAPTIAYRFTKDQAIGFSPLLTYQRFEAQGLQLFGQFGFSRDASKLTNNGTSSSRGLGYRLGYLGRFGDLRIGASYSPKLDMTEFDKYEGLFAEQGDFDIPENYGVGFAYQATPKLLIGIDVTKVEYSKVPSVGNPSGTAGAFCANPLLSQGRCLGDDNGPGFGWNDVTTKKIGFEYAATEKLTVRAGYNKGDNPIEPQDVTFNILAPGVIEEHYTVGATYTLSETGEVSFHYMRAPSTSVSGNSAFAAFSAGTPRETIDMDQQSLSLSFGLSY